MGEQARVIQYTDKSTPRSLTLVFILFLLNPDLCVYKEEGGLFIDTIPTVSLHLYMIEKGESFKLRSSPQYYDSCSIYFKPNKNSILKIFVNISFTFC